MGELVRERKYDMCEENEERLSGRKSCFQRVGWRKGWMREEEVEM